MDSVAAPKLRKLHSMLIMPVRIKRPRCSDISNQLMDELTKLSLHVCSNGVERVRDRPFSFKVITYRPRVAVRFSKRLLLVMLTDVDGREPQLFMIHSRLTTTLTRMFIQSPLCAAKVTLKTAPRKAQSPGNILHTPAR